MISSLMLLFVFRLLALCSASVFYGIPFLNVNLSPLLTSQPIFVKRNGFDHLKVRIMSMSSSVVPGITSYPFMHPPKPFMKPSIVPASSPTIQGPVAGPTVGKSRRHHHRLHHGKITHVIPPSPSPLSGCDQTCVDPLTSTPIGSPCGCVLPMKVRLLLYVSVYAVFPVVTELEIEIATGTYLTQSQVVITGANADSQDQDKTEVDINLVPLGEKFDNTTALLTYDRLWRKKLTLNRTLFGDYEVVYITYPGLPSSPLNGNGPNGSPGNRQYPITATFVGKSQKMNPRTIFVIVLSAVVLLVVCCAAISVFIKYRKISRSSNAAGPVFTTPTSKRRGFGAMLSSDQSTSTLSVFSAMPTSILSVKTFTLAELEKATEKFSSRKILGEGGFGCVYHGTIEDGGEVAVKLLNRDNNQNGDREFIAEVEMLSRLHHRNLVKLIGICIEGRTRCLVYELVRNGSVESHLHGVDKQKGPLDWDARLKIALGAARGLAYLHEDSNPRVIHRDFKASNVLLEDDFTPKVSDFGLAREATEGSSHISTRVMGTFGYVAPEYAMTGHLLVKSDVYSYGVVLLELLSGRKPVDMSQPPGEENLVTWARPLLTTREGLQQLVDPTLSGTYDFDDMAKVAAIASMCVHPEVTQRPFMGEVVQALKLIYNDKDEVGGDNSTQRDSSVVDSDFKGEHAPSDSSWWNAGGGATPRLTYGQASSFITMDYSSGPLEDLENRPFSASSFDNRVPISHGNRSGPLRTVRSKPLFYRSKGSMSEHGGLLSKPFWSEASF
ncbi:receptor-like serine/threonine-protein kinase ALE2 [Bidens hawaiensis]|uniref:receptor-like serine/threonine-protein kinase ALE2 n=1 Tax=Bidens hawaiensis TaxID=980011 RepID=UPI00404B3001